MKVRLKELKPNPMRDFRTDPIDPAAVEAVKASIAEYGFWGGVICRAVNGHVEIGAGHHRIEAAQQSGIAEADVSIASLDDMAMLRVYATENATQRSQAGTARTGSTAAAIRLATGRVLRGFAPIGANPPHDDETRHQLATLQGNLTSQKGIGWKLLLEMLAGIPGITKKSIGQDLANLKKSGLYAKIIAEVADEVTAELEARRLAAEREAKEARVREDEEQAREAEAEAERLKGDELTADEAREAAEAIPVTFDYEGVAKYLRIPERLDVFRDIVTKENVARYLAVEQQAEVARRLVELYDEEHAVNPQVELSGFYIRENILAVIERLQAAERQRTREEQEAMERQHWEERFQLLQEQFGMALRRMVNCGERLAEHVGSAPSGVAFRYTPGLRENIRLARRLVNEMARKV